MIVVVQLVPELVVDRTHHFGCLSRYARNSHRVNRIDTAPKAFAQVVRFGLDVCHSFQSDFASLVDSRVRRFGQNQ